jgi:hypothetical protein
VKPTDESVQLPSQTIRDFSAHGLGAGYSRAWMAGMARVKSNTLLQLPLQDGEDPEEHLPNKMRHGESG